MSSFTTPVLMLESEVVKHASAKPMTTFWLLRQAAALGLSFLRKCEQMNFSTAEEVDKFRKQVRSEMMGVVEEE